MAVASSPSSQPHYDEFAWLLQRFLAATKASDIERYRHELVINHIEPVIRQVISKKMRTAVGKQEGGANRRQEAAEDIYSNALASMCKQVEQWRLGSPVPERPLNYAAVVAYNAHKKWMDKNCEWNPDTQVHYLMTHQDGFALWKQENTDIALAGFALWRDQKRQPVEAFQLKKLIQDPQNIVQKALRQRGGKMSVRDGDPALCMAALLDAIGSPVDLTTLVSLWETLREKEEPPFREILGHRDENPYGDSDDREIGEEKPETLISPVEAEMEHRDTLGRLWTHILRLPREQRIALLLNMQKADVRDLHKKQIATFADIAKAFGRTVQELGTIWLHLPLDDDDIAKELGTTAPKVKNLRQSAYRTLGWTSRPFDRKALHCLWRGVCNLDAPRPAILMLHARDAHHISLLSLIPQQKIAGREEIATALQIPLAQLNELWPKLPLGFSAIASLLGITLTEVVLLHQEAREAAARELQEIEKES